MKIIVVLTLLAMIGAITCKAQKINIQATQSAGSYLTRIVWLYNNSLQQLLLDTYDLTDSQYQPYIDISIPMAFNEGEWEIGGAYKSLNVGNYLYLSVSFLGPDGFSRYDTATTLGMDYFELDKLTSLNVQEVFV